MCAHQRTFEKEVNSKKFSGCLPNKLASLRQHNWSNFCNRFYGLRTGGGNPGQSLVRMERVITISSALVLQERKLNVKKKFKRMRLLRKEGEKAKEGKKEEENVEKENENRRKRRGSSLRPDLAEYKVFARRRREKSKFLIEVERCGHRGKCLGPSRSTPSDPGEEFPPHCTMGTF